MLDDFDKDLTAAIYALGSLDANERRDFARTLETSPAQQSMVEDWQIRLAPLDSSAGFVEPDPADWHGIARRLGIVTSGTRTAREQAGAWIRLGPGVEIKHLQVDPVSAARTALLRLQPGSVATAHLHDQTEHCIVLEGDVTMDGHLLTKGDFHIAPAGTMHSAVRSQGGCLLFLRWEPLTN